jgi:hypothetical protein
MGAYSYETLQQETVPPEVAEPQDDPPDSGMAGTFIQWGASVRQDMREAWAFQKQQIEGSTAGRYLPLLVMDEPAADRPVPDGGRAPGTDSSAPDQRRSEELVKQFLEARYQEEEARRAYSYEQAFDAGSAVDRGVLVVAGLPRDVRVVLKQDSIKIDADDFAKFAEVIPGTTLDEPLRKMLASLRSVSLDGSKVKVEGETSIPLELGANLPTADLTLKNATFDIVPDRNDPKKIHLENIQGISVSALGAGGDIKKITFSLAEDGQKNPLLRVEIPAPVAPEAKSDDYLSRFKRGLNRVASSVIPDKTTIDIALGSKEGAAQVEEIFRGVKGWSEAGQNRDFARLLKSVSGLDIERDLGGALSGITGVSKNGDKLEISRKGKSTHDLGGLPIEISEVVRARVGADLKNPRLEEIQGIALKLPIPAEVAGVVGLKTPIEAQLKEISFSEKDRDGNRLLTVKTDSLLESVEIKVGPDMKPLPVDKSGTIALDLVVDRGGKLPVRVEFKPEQLEKPPANGPDFKVTLKGKDEDYMKMIESFSGAKLESPIKDMVSGIRSVSKQGDRLRIERDKATRHDLGGVSLDASKLVEFKVSSDKDGVRIADIKGIGVKVPIQLPEAVKRLGIDPGDHLSTNLRSVQVSAADANGNRKVVVETSQHLRRVGLQLGPDMQPAKDAHGNWYFYGFADNPLAGKQLPFTLRFDRHNNLNMSTQELMRLGGQATWQAADGSPSGIGLGIIAVGTEIGAQVLDTRDNFVRGCQVIGNAVSDAWDWIWK